MTRIALPVTKPPHVSYSSLSLFAACPLRYYFQKVLGMTDAKISASLLLGIAFHEAIRHHYLELGSDHEVPSLKKLLDVFWSAWRTRTTGEIRYPKGEDRTSTGRLAERMIAAFQRSDVARPRGTLLGVETEFRGTLRRDVPEFVARIDLIEEDDRGWILTDFKTTRWAWSEEQAFHARTQLLLYHEIVKPWSDGRPIRLRLVTITKTRFPEVQTHDVPVTRSSLARATRIAVLLWRAIEAGHFYPAPSPLQCPTCPYRRPWPVFPRNQGERTCIEMVARPPRTN